jgi:lycopene cyclase domain-containing protein
LFNVVVAGGPVLASVFYPAAVFPEPRAALVAVLLPALVFIVWDGLVTGSFWWFNERFVTGLKLFRLPVEEVLLFFTVPYASLFLWVNFEALVRSGPGQFCWLHLLVPSLFLLTALFFLFLKRYYTFMACLFWALSLFADAVIGTNLFCRPSFQWFLLALFGLTFAFNGYLTARPVVLYNNAVKTNLNVWTVPIEDFLFVFSLVLLVFILYERLSHVL